MRTLLIAVAALGYGLWAVWPDFAHGTAAAILLLTGQVALAVTGGLFLAEGRRLVGVLFVAAAFAELTAALTSRPWGWHPFVAGTVRPVGALLLMTVLLSYPHRRVGYRSFVLGAGALVLTADLADALTWNPAPPGRPPVGFAWITLYDGGPGQRPAYGVYWLLVIAVAVAALALVVHRALTARGLERRELVPVFFASAVYGFAILSRAVWMVIPYFTGEGDPLAPAHVPEVVSISAVAAPLLIPAAFLAAAVRRRLDRAAVADLVTGIARPATVESVREALRRALADPGLELFTGDPPGADGRLDLQITGSTGGPLAHVRTAPELRRRGDVVEAALGAAALSLENARLHSDLQRQLRQVEDSRARIVEAGVAERRRVERDLHDGAQQRLLALAATLGRLNAVSGDPAVRELVDEARADLRTALSELRDLARGIHPAVLEQIGLAAAVGSVAEALPVPIEIRIAPLESGPATETTLYFVICEALTNAIKHAEARRITVSVAQEHGEIVAAVVDDGRGGAALRQGGGLAGLADRVNALGGVLRLHSPPQGGTRLEARLARPVSG
ncbi:sensor histidine kinase [Planobispora takensis]|uniref:histidine kinase n=1 Tax=Planobispora takensis TaxID=1367882 RepID=A0A8J3T4R1_9ACTN|nr:histidine kinase [Planobispora takensis]GII04411.1 hypothetical protein Pta02_64190 [Planobispora takensis]